MPQRGCEELLTFFQNPSLFQNYIYSMQHNSIIAQRYLAKSKKYYTNKTVLKDKENIIDGDIRHIVEKLSEPENLNRIIHSCRPHRKQVDSLSSHIYSVRFRKELSELGENCKNFFGKSRMSFLEKKKLKKDMVRHINKMKQPHRSKSSIYQEYLQLSQETSDYLEYYLTNFSGEVSGKASELLKEQGKTIILLIFRKSFACFDNNPSDINNRILLAFHLNPLNDFQFIPWEKFMKMRKLISCEFNRHDCCEFIFDYFFLNEEKTLKGSQFWTILKSVLRKLSVCLDGNALDILIERVMEEGLKMIPEESTFRKEELRRIVMEEPMFIWNEFVTLIFT